MTNQIHHLSQHHSLPPPSAHFRRIVNFFPCWHHSHLFALLLRMNERQPWHSRSASLTPPPKLPRGLDTRCAAVCVVARRYLAGHSGQPTRFRTRCRSRDGQSIASANRSPAAWPELWGSRAETSAWVIVQAQGGGARRRIEVGQPQRARDCRARRWRLGGMLSHSYQRLCLLVAPVFTTDNA